MVRAPRVCYSSASPGLEYPSPLPSASEARTRPRPVDPAAPHRLPRLHRPPSIHQLPPGSLVPPAPTWSGVDPPSPLDSSTLTAPRRSVSPAPLGSFLPSAPPGSSVALYPPRLIGSLLALCLGLLHHLLCRRWLVPWCRRPSLLRGSSLRRLYHHHGCGLGPAVLLLLRVPPVSSLAAPSFVAPLVSVCRPPPGCPSSSRATSQVPTHPSPCCYHGSRTHLPGGGEVSGLWTCLCFCSL